MRPLAVLCLPLALLLCACTASPQTVTVARVIDGDTFVSTSGQHYRLWGVDAPEVGQSWSAEATAALTELTTGQTVSIEPKGQSYDREVVRTTVEGEDISAELARRGLAHWEPQFAPRSAGYSEAEAEARAAGRGIWSDKR
ncbi:MAG: thermonuclease family protein [Victivallaceae bacterium]